MAVSSGRKRRHSTSSAASGSNASEKREKQQRRISRNKASSSNGLPSKSKSSSRRDRPSTYAEENPRTYTAGESDNAQDSDEVEDDAATTGTRSDENEHDRRARKKREDRARNDRKLGRSNAGDDNDDLRRKLQRKRVSTKDNDDEDHAQTEQQKSKSKNMKPAESDEEDYVSTSFSSKRKKASKLADAPASSKARSSKRQRTVSPGPEPERKSAKQSKSKSKSSENRKERPVTLRSGSESDNGDVRVPTPAPEPEPEPERALVKKKRSASVDEDGEEWVTVRAPAPFMLKDGATLGRGGPLIVNGRPLLPEQPPKTRKSKQKAIMDKDPDIPVPSQDDYERRQKILSDDDEGDKENALVEDEEEPDLGKLLGGSNRTSYKELARGAAELAADSEAEEQQQEMQIDEPVKSRRPRRGEELSKPSRARSAPKGVRKSSSTRDFASTASSSKKGRPSATTHQNRGTRPGRRISNSPPKRSQLADTLQTYSSDDSDGIVVANSSTVVSSRAKKPEASSSRRDKEEKSLKSDNKRKQTKGKERRKSPEPDSEQDEEVIAIPLSENGLPEDSDGDPVLPPPLSSKAKRSFEIGGSKKKDKKAEKPERKARTSPIRLVDVSDEAMSEPEEPEESYEQYIHPLSPEPGVPYPLANADVDMEHPGTGAVLEVRDEADPEPPAAERDGVLQSGLSAEELRETRQEQDEANLSKSHEMAVEAEKQGEQPAGNSSIARAVSPPHRDGSPASATDEDTALSPPPQASGSTYARKNGGTPTRARKGGARSLPLATEAEFTDAAAREPVRARKGGPVQAAIEDDFIMADSLAAEDDEAVPLYTGLAARTGGPAPVAAAAEDSSSDENVVIATSSKATTSTRIRPRPTVKAESSTRTATSKELRARSRSSRSASAKEPSPPKPRSAREDSSSSRRKAKKARTEHGASKPRISQSAQLYTSSEDEIAPVSVKKSSTVKDRDVDAVEQAVDELAAKEAIPAISQDEFRTNGRRASSSPGPHAEVDELEDDAMQVEQAAALEDGTSSAVAPAAPVLDQRPRAEAAKDRSMSVRVDVEISPELPEPSSSKAPPSASKVQAVSQPIMESQPVAEASSDEEADEAAALAEIAAALAQRQPGTSARPVAHGEISTTYTVSYDIEVTEMWSDDEEDDLLDGVMQLFEGLIEEPEERARLSRVRSPAPRPSRKGKERAVEPDAASPERPGKSERPAAAAEPVASISANHDVTAAVDDMQVDAAAPTAEPDQPTAAPSQMPQAASPVRSIRSSPRRQSPRKSQSPIKDFLEGASASVPPEALDDISTFTQSHTPADLLRSPPIGMTSDEEVAMQVTSARKPTFRAAKDDVASASSPSTSKPTHRKRLSSAHVIIEVPRSPYQSSKSRSPSKRAASPVHVPTEAAEPAEEAPSVSDAIAAAVVAAAAGTGTDAVVDDAQEDQAMADATETEPTPSAETVRAALVRDAQTDRSRDTGSEAGREAEVDAIIDEVGEAAEEALQVAADPEPAEADVGGMETDEVVREETTLAVQSRPAAGEPSNPEEISLSVEIEEETRTHVSVQASQQSVPTVPDPEPLTDTIAETIAEAAATADKETSTAPLGAVPGSDPSKTAELPAAQVAAAIEAEQEGEADAEGEADLEAAMGDVVDAVTQTNEQAAADVDVEGEDEAPEIESSLPGPARDNAPSGVEDVTAPGTTAAVDANGTVESSEEESSSSESEDASGSASSSNAEGDASGDTPDAEDEPPFSQHELIAWAEDLKDSQDPRIIAREGAEKLFGQMQLDMEGPHSLLLAWKLEASTLRQCEKSEFIKVLRENEIDTPTKLARYLKELASTTLTISTHTRFNDEGEAVKSLRAPEAYRTFYEWTFGYTSAQGTELPMAFAIQLWLIVLEPYFAIAKDFMAFARGHQGDEGKTVSKTLWEKTLDFCLTVELPPAGAEGAGAGLVNYDAQRDSWPSMLEEYAVWVQSGRPAQQ